jgi:hypothetical protein
LTSSLYGGENWQSANHDIKIRRPPTCEHNGKNEPKGGNNQESIRAYEERNSNIYFSDQEMRRIQTIVRRWKWQEAGGGCVIRSFIKCTLHQILLG